MLLLSLCTLFELSMIEPEIFVVDGNWTSIIVVLIVL